MQQRDSYAQTRRYRCYGMMDQRGRWRAWQFGPDSTEEMDHLVAGAAATGKILFASVQQFAPPPDESVRWWRLARESYVGENALPHITPLYFDIDCDGDLNQALLWSRELVTFFTGQLRLPEPAVRVWFSGSKGTHILIDSTALGIQPDAALTIDMKAVALDLTKRLASQGAPTLTIDTAVYSLPRMLRLPDQLNPRSGLFKVELSHDELMRRSATQIIELAGKPRGPCWTKLELPTKPIPEAEIWWVSALARARRPREFRIKTAQVAGLKIRPDGFAADELTSDVMPHCIQGLMKANVGVGQRNRCELQIACWAKAAKLSQNRGLSMLTAWTDRNRPELSADNAYRKAESIIRSVYANPSYGFSCTAARSASRSVGFEPNCPDCQVIKPRHSRLIHSLRVHHDDQWSPVSPLTLEQARGLIAAAVNSRVASARTREPGDSTAGRGQDPLGGSRLGRARDTGRVCHPDP